MSYKLFLDDERFPAQEGYTICRSSKEAIDLLEDKGVPSEICFDHDLGGTDTSMKYIHFLIDYILDGGCVIPSNFTYSVHSQNPIGARNIKSIMDGFLKDQQL